MRGTTKDFVPIAVIIAFFCVLRYAIAVEGAPVEDKQTKRTETSSPITVDAAKPGYATFINKKHPGNRIGYRFFEGGPRVSGKVPGSNEEAGIDLSRIAAEEREFSNRPGVKSFKTNIGKQGGWVKQQWTTHFAPAPDGIDLLWVVETYDEGLPEHYSVTQCFRMTGVAGMSIGSDQALYRHKIAKTPAFSEYDLWRQEGEAAKTSLTWVVRQGKWEAVPADRKRFSACAPLGMRLGMSSKYAPVDCGLITRTNKEGTWVCGIFWNRTTRVASHWPADCLHPFVDIGNIPPKSKRAIRGKIYWFNGTKEDLLKRWKGDFRAN